MEYLNFFWVISRQNIHLCVAATMFKFSRWPDVSELSVSVLSLISSKQYYFEILHKQDDKGSDHVEVGVSMFLDFQPDSAHNNNVFWFPVLVCVV